MIKDEELLKIGTFTRLHGKRGEIQCMMDNGYWDETDADFVVMKMEGLNTPFRVIDWRSKSSESILFTLNGIDNEEKALKLCGKEVYMLRCDAAMQEDQSMLTWEDLVGWTLRDADGQEVTIREVDCSTLNTLAKLDDERLVPLHEDLINQLDKDNKIITLLIQIP